MATIKAMVKNSLKRKDGKCKVIIRLNHQGQEASIKNEWYASESYTRKNWELKCSQKHTLDIYSITVQKVLEKHPNEISKSSVIFSAMLAQERFRHSEHLLTDIASDIMLLLSVWLKP